MGIGSTQGVMASAGIDELKSAVASLDLAGLEALQHEGVRRS